MPETERTVIIWRHADAGEPLDDRRADFERELSRKGERQARATAQWLRHRLPTEYSLISSPAPRALQTAQALGTPTVDDALAPEADLSTLLAKSLERRATTTVLVGHQPQLGEFIAAWLAGRAERGARDRSGRHADDPKRMTLPGTRLPQVAPMPLALRKSAVWWLRICPQREPHVLVLAVRDPKSEPN